MPYWKKIINELNIRPPALQPTIKNRPPLLQFNLGKAFPGIYLTYREAQCTYFLLQGYNNKEVAALTQLSLRTIEFYLKNLRKKLNCRNKGELLSHIAYSQFTTKTFETALQQNASA
jgi:DNA-binding CsgD family transcriptional regulator